MMSPSSTSARQSADETIDAAAFFDRVYQAHVGSYRSALGLGLYISHEIVSLHGRRLSAEFPAEGGSMFLVSLPTAIARRAIGGAAAREGGKG